tara:strand:+ start:7792 stop:8289 length:498 start_codon:yes stop_codon:yes gene_type:complete
MKRTLLLASLALPLTFAACGGSAPSDPLDAGAAALQDGDHAAALTSFIAAMDGAEKGTEDWKVAAVGRYQAMAHTSPKAASTEFIAVAGDEASGLGEKDYSKVLGELYNSKAYVDALSVADAGKKRWPDSEKMTIYIEKLKEKAKESGDAALGNALEGMGYLGGD